MQEQTESENSKEEAASLGMQYVLPIEAANYFNFDNVFEFLKIPPYPKDVVTRAYSEGHRIYHNTSHINNMLRWVPAAHPKLEALLEAILWHDLVYPNHLIPMGQAESLSIAEYTLYTFIAGKSFPDIDPSIRMPRSVRHDYTVIECISASARHLETQKGLSDTAKLFLDIDLQSFAQPWLEMNKDSENVRLELEPIVGGPEVFLKGNLKFMAQLLKRDRIYYTASDAWETRARANLKKRMALIKKLITQLP